MNEPSAPAVAPEADPSVVYEVPPPALAPSPVSRAGFPTSPSDARRAGPDIGAELSALFAALGATDAERTELEKICYCESNNTQLLWSGEPLISETSDIGACQINWVNWDTADALGHDLTNLEGNAAFTLFMYRERGSYPWKNSAACWDKPVPGW